MIDIEIFKEKNMRAQALDLKTIFTIVKKGK